MQRGSARAVDVAIDARWLWDRDMQACDGADTYRRGRDRCSMAVGSRQDGCRCQGLGPRPSRSMLDGCGIETSTRRGAPRWLELRSRSMLDGCGIETTASATRILRAERSVAIDARWLWDRDSTRADVAAAPRVGSRSMLDGCGIETSTREASAVRSGDRSRSMLDGCGIETKRSRNGLPQASGQVAIDARWLWDRDLRSRRVRRRPVDGRDRCSMAVGSRPHDVRATASARPRSRSMLDGCGIETRRRRMSRRA